LKLSLVTLVRRGVLLPVHDLDCDFYSGIFLDRTHDGCETCFYVYVVVVRGGKKNCCRRQFLVRKERVLLPSVRQKPSKRRKTSAPDGIRFFVVVVVVCLLSRRTSGSNLLLEIVFGENLGDILNGDNRPWEIPSSLSSSS